MDKPRFVYVTYIMSTPEKVWQALTDGELTRKYWWRRRNASDWKVGSRWEHRDAEDPGTVDIVGKVPESDRPNRLVVSWVSPAEADDPAKTSRVTYAIESVDQSVRLTVTHEDLEPGSKMLKGITEGWPAVLSSLKSFLETGRALPGSDQRDRVAKV